MVPGLGPPSPGYFSVLRVISRRPSENQVFQNHDMEAPGKSLFTLLFAIGFNDKKPHFLRPFLGLGLFWWYSKRLVTSSPAGRFGVSQNGMSVGFPQPPHRVP